MAWPLSLLILRTEFLPVILTTPKGDGAKNGGQGFLSQSRNLALFRAQEWRINYVYQDNNQCVATLTEGSFTYSSTTVIFSPDETDAIKSFASEVGAGYADPPSIIATAFPITLLDQQLLAGSSEVPTIRSSSANSSSTSPAQMSSYQTNDVSTPLKQNGSFANTPAAFIGLAVGLVGFVVFACLGILYFRQYRKTRLHPAAKDNSTTKDNKWVELGNKPELEGSQVNQKQYTKVELDALVIRAELEGSLGEEQDPVGIGFLKPELQGTPGAWGLLGVFLRRKAELEAPSNSEAEKQGNSRQFNSQQEQSFASRTAEPVELDSESLYRNTNARIISGGL
ncbi:hypothetical protein F5Y08DRAFT_355792 [Xylaria arbuscula]|nr:hypothetical protein F5Y08DRAFT_355792 [Xylaria arbuscula]